MLIDKKMFDTYEEPRKIYIENENILPLYTELKELRDKRVTIADEGQKVFEAMEEKKKQFLEEMGELDKQYKEKQNEVDGISREIQFIEHKTSPIILEELEGKLDEFEDITSFDVDDKGVFVNVMYLVDLWVKTHRENVEKRKAKVLEDIEKEKNTPVESPYVEEIK